MGGVLHPLTRSSGGKLFGTTVTYGAGPTFRATDWLSLHARVSGQHRSHTEELGEGELLNSGGDWLAGEVSASATYDKRVFFGLGVRGPFYANVNGRQISETFSVSGSIGLIFGPDASAGESDPHDHGNEHDTIESNEESTDHGSGHSADNSDTDPAGDASDAHSLDAPVPSQAPGDFQQAAVGGATFDLRSTLAPDKVTVIDFWADWCEPCDAISAFLQELSRKEPKLAVRTVEVPDFDSPAAQQHLRGRRRTWPTMASDVAGRLSKVSTDFRARRGNRCIGP